jgi:hypothetical protein
MDQEELAYFQMEGAAEEIERDHPKFDYEHNKTETYDDHDCYEL